MNQYFVGGKIYDSLKEAKLRQWQCSKCDNTFGSMKQLRNHKMNNHAY